MSRFIERLQIWFVWNLLPHGILRWAFYRILAEVTTMEKWSHETPLDLTWETIIERWNEIEEGDCDSCEE